MLLLENGDHAWWCPTERKYFYRSFKKKANLPTYYLKFIREIDSNTLSHAIKYFSTLDMALLVCHLPMSLNRHLVSSASLSLSLSLLNFKYLNALSSLTFSFENEYHIKSDTGVESILLENVDKSYSIFKIFLVFYTSL